MYRKAREYRRRQASRRGFALADVIIGGMMLGIGLAAVLTVTSRSLSAQSDGEKRLTASWLADELLSMVLVEEPDQYSLIHDTTGRFDEPFDEFTYEVEIDEIGRSLPYRTIATVRWSDRPGDYIQVETLIARKVYLPDQDELRREPYEPVDRDERYWGDEEGSEGEGG